MARKIKELKEQLSDAQLDEVEERTEELLDELSSGDILREIAASLEKLARKVDRDPIKEALGPLPDILRDVSSMLRVEALKYESRRLEREIGEYILETRVGDDGYLDSNFKTRAVNGDCNPEHNPVCPVCGAGEMWNTRGRHWGDCPLRNA